MNDERTKLARKLRSIYWESNPPPEDGAFETWLYVADEVREMIQAAVLETNVKDAVTGYTEIMIRAKAQRMGAGLHDPKGEILGGRVRDAILANVAGAPSEVCGE